VSKSAKKQQSQVQTIQRTEVAETVACRGGGQTERRPRVSKARGGIRRVKLQRLKCC